MKIKLYCCGGERPISQYPLGVGYLKTNVNADIEIVNDRNQLKDCDLIGLSTCAWGMKEAVGIAKETNIPTVVGGQGTLWPKVVDSPFTYIVRGPGEKALQEIVDGTDKRLFCAVNDKDIDWLKFPDRGECKRYIPILSSRGCPYHCKFCSSWVFWGGVSFHSAEYFMAEVAYVHEKYPNAKVLYTMDDLFVANKPRFDKIYDMWVEGEWNKKLALLGFVRANLVTVDLVQKMKAMGFLRVRFGAESGSDRILKLLNKGSTVEINQQAIDICNEVGLEVTAAFMTGLPTETPEEVRMTRDFIDRNKGKMKVAGYYKYRAFPGTAFYAGEDLLEESMNVRI